MQVSEIQLYELLKAKIGTAEAEAFIQILEKKVDKKFEEKSQIFKDDIKSLKEYMDRVFATKEDLANLKVELSRSIYIVGILQYLAILASVITIIRFMM